VLAATGGASEASEAGKASEARKTGRETAAEPAEAKA